MRLVSGGEPDSQFIHRTEQPPRRRFFWQLPHFSRSDSGSDPFLQCDQSASGVDRAPVVPAQHTRAILQHNSLHVPFQTCPKEGPTPCCKLPPDGFLLAGGIEDALSDLCLQLGIDRREHPFLAVEVVIQRSPRDAGPANQLSLRHLIEPAGAEQFPARRDEPIRGRDAACFLCGHDLFTLQSISQLAIHTYRMYHAPDRPKSQSVALSRPQRIL